MARKYIRIPVAVRFNRMVPKGISPELCWNWLGSTCGKGQAQFKYYGDGSLFGLRKKEGHAARISWMLNNNQLLPDGFAVLHSCDNPLCVNPAHLFLGTQLDNIKDMHQKGRASGGSMPGAVNPSAKLTEEQVKHLRSDFENEGISYTVLGRKYGICAVTAQDICSRKTWRHI